MNFALFRAAFDSGLAAANIFQQVIPADLYLGGWSDNRTLRQILKEWLDQHPGIDAICCTHDHIAAAMLNVLAEQGVRVPEDVAVTGSLDSAESFGLASGELTTVNTCIDVAMMHVVRLLLEGRRVDDGQDAPIIAVKPRLVLGRSTIGALTQSS
jgi:DNA-binding LacI/PurR family transcriptional regulator